MTSALISPFDRLAGPDEDPLVAAATALTTHAAEDPSCGPLVIVIRPHTSYHQVLSGGGSGSLRAAVSVAASGHDRLWSTSPTGTTDEVAVRTLPEVLRAAAEACRIPSVHIGRVDTESGVACVALWFETPDSVTTLTERQTALAVLHAAAEKSAPTERPRQMSDAPTVIELDDPASIEREFNPADPDLDSVTGVADADRFAALISGYDADEANLLVIDIDDFDTVDAETANGVLRTIADRLVASIRSGDIIGRVGPHSFGLLFDNIERSEAFQVAKRLAQVIRQPVGAISLTATIALAHQSGMIDLDELRELADEAIASGKRAGRGRLVMAA